MRQLLERTHNLDFSGVNWAFSLNKEGQKIKIVHQISRFHKLLLGKLLVEIPTKIVNEKGGEFSIVH